MLTTRQNEILNLILDNRELINKELAAKIFISEKTIKFHLTNILRYFKLANKKELCNYFDEINKNLPEGSVWN